MDELTELKRRELEVSEVLRRKYKPPIGWEHNVVHLSHRPVSYLFETSITGARKFRVRKEEMDNYIWERIF